MNILKTQSTEAFASSWSRWFFATCFLFLIYLGYLMMESYLMPLFLAMVMVVAFGPIYERLEEKLGGRKNLASTITCALILLIIILPLFFIATMLATQAFSLYNTVAHQVELASKLENLQDSLGFLTPYLNKLQELTGISSQDILAHVGDFVQRISAMLYSNLTNLLAGVTNLVIGFSLMMFVTFFLLMDGRTLAQTIFGLSPMPDDLNDQVRADMVQMLRTTLKGTVVLALINGTLGGVGFFLLGVPKALFWGTVMVFASVVPIVGISLVWLPAVIYLAVIGDYWQAGALTVWSIGVGTLCDNILRPRLLAGESNLHPLLTFFSVLGGLSLFGMAGLILGPLVLAILLSLMEVYKRYFLQKPQPACEVPLETEPEPAKTQGE